MDDLSITIFDILVAAIVVISALLSFSRGAVREIFSLASWVGAALTAWFAYPVVRPLVAQALASPLIVDLVAAALVFLVPLIAFKIIAGMLSRGVEGSRLSGADKSLGLVYGVARGALIVSIAYLLGSMLIDPGRFPAWVREARLAPAVETGASWLADFLPSDLEEEGRETVEDALDRAQRNRATPGEPQPGGAPEGETGYPSEPREQMNRLIESLR
jgi:membrane protein required for colicin V production